MSTVTLPKDFTTFGFEPYQIYAVERVVALRLNWTCHSYEEVTNSSKVRRVFWTPPENAMNAPSMFPATTTTNAVIPPFSTDLNFTSLFESTLFEDQLKTYTSYLKIIVRKDFDMRGINQLFYEDAIFASAIQRCCAFLCLNDMQDLIEIYNREPKPHLKN